MTAYATTLRCSDSSLNYPVYMDALDYVLIGAVLCQYKNKPGGIPCCVCVKKAISAFGIHFF